MVTPQDTHVRRLVARAKPGLTSRAIHTQGFPVTKPLSRFDDAAAKRRLPDATYMERLAQILEVDLAEVVEACVRDAGFPLEAEYDRQQHRAAQLVGQIQVGRRVQFVDGIEKMMRASAAMRSRGPS